MHMPAALIDPTNLSILCAMAYLASSLHLQIPWPSAYHGSSTRHAVMVACVFAVLTLKARLALLHPSELAQLLLYYSSLFWFSSLLNHLLPTMSGLLAVLFLCRFLGCCSAL